MAVELRVWTTVFAFAFLLGVGLTILAIMDYWRNRTSPINGQRRSIRLTITRSDMITEHVRLIQVTCGLSAAAIAEARANGHLLGEEWAKILIWLIISIGFGFPVVSTARLFARGRFDRDVLLLQDIELREKEVAHEAGRVQGVVEEHDARDVLDAAHIESHESGRLQGVGEEHAHDHPAGVVHKPRDP